MKITKQMIILWSVCMLAVIIVSVSVMSLIMVSKKVTYGLDIQFDNLKHIKYVNSNGSKKMYTNEFAPAPGINACKEILKLLEISGKTNKFAQVFWQEDGAEVVARTSLYSVDNVKSLSNGVYIVITFSDPQYYIFEYETNLLRFESAVADSGKTKVQSIYIPLGNTEDSFTEQTWYICAGSSSSSTSVTHTFTTYGNYYELYNYVAELTYGL